MDFQIATQLRLPVGTLLAAAEPSMTLIDFVSLIVMILIAMGSLYFWYHAFARLQQNKELIPYQRSECVLGFVDLFAMFVLWLGSQVATMSLLVALTGAKIESGPDVVEEYGVWLLYLSAATGIGSFLLGSIFLFIRYRTLNSFGLRFNQVSKQVGYGVAAFVMLFPPMILLQWALTQFVEYDHPVLSVLAENPSFVSIFSCWAAAVLAAPFVEEFLFRGVFHHWLERLSVSKLSSDKLLFGGSNNEPVRSDTHSETNEIPNANFGQPSRIDYDSVNPYQSPFTTPQNPTATNEHLDSEGPKFAYWPILISSLCFAAVHIGQGLAPIPLFFLALGLGYLFRQTGSLIACITVHFMLNSYSMLVFTLLILFGETP